VSTQIAYETPAPPHCAGAVAVPKIAFFGIFGIQNLGNECTLQAILQNVRRHLPSSAIYAISFNPADTAQRHGLDAVPVSQQHFGGAAPRHGLAKCVAKLLRLARRIPGEWNDWSMAVKTLRGTDMMVMTGTGMLTDYMTTASGFPYHVFRWTAAARLTGCRVSYVGVGVGPIYGRASRFLITRALSLAGYRSFRDENSRNRIRNNGFNSDKDHVFPDLVFSLAPEMFPRRTNSTGPVRQVGLGVMDHRDIHMWSDAEHATQYSAYLDKMCEFVCWLVKHHYQVRILQGDAKHDSGTRAELRQRLEARGIHYDHDGIIDEGCATVQDLIRQIAQSDLVVSPRFHNLLLGLMMNIPAISISYDPKNDCLLEGVGLGEFRQSLPELDVQRLIEQFTHAVARGQELKPLIAKRAQQYRDALEMQYELIFAEYKSRSQTDPSLIPNLPGDKHAHHGTI